MRIHATVVGSLCVALVACGGSGMDSGTTGGAGGASGGQGGGIGTGGGGSGGGGGTVAGGTGGGTVAGATGTSCTHISCNADFPCFVGGRDKPKCITGDITRYQIGYDVGCAQVCGTPCCSGSSCRTTSDLCPQGTVCVYARGSSTGECVNATKACGGSLGNTCGAGEYCDVGQDGDCEYSNAGAVGMCYPLPATAQCASDTQPVCGCDGVTYANDCARKTANAALDYVGVCTGGG